MYIDRRTDAEWAADIVSAFPKSWQDGLLSSWAKEHDDDRRTGNLGLLERVRTLADSARGGISPDASDAEICNQADNTARDFIRRLERVTAIGGFRNPAMVERLQSFYCRNLLRERGLLDLWQVKGKRSRQGAIKRIQCAKWWRRAYRKLHARTVESCAISIGLVGKTAGAYASDDTVQRRLAQNRRNAAVLESVTAVNDQGQAYTLAELAATGTANKPIRRMELLTRVAGFELIAKERGDIAYMVTMTCPSRFHKKSTRADGRVFNNPKYDGSTPDEAQRYLSRQWSRCRAALLRAGLRWYGVRVAEPQHDATPHWHCLVFMPPTTDKGQDAALEMTRLVRRYFLLNESPDERGAEQHRCDFTAIDWSKGSAVGYVAKYVSKNIDGHGVGEDLLGLDAVTSAKRVEAWASTWRIRQFQQIGGAPVSVWRELRRLHPDNVKDNAPEALREAMHAINAEKTEPGMQATAWKRYQAAQGGVNTPRTCLRIRLLREQTGECGRYGEAMPPRPVGVVTEGARCLTTRIHAARPGAGPEAQRVVFSVESERAEWLIGHRDAEVAVAAAREFFERSGEAASTWIYVNNCTPVPSAGSELSTRWVHRPKLRRFQKWETDAGTASQQLPCNQKMKHEVFSHHQGDRHARSAERCHAKEAA